MRILVVTIGVGLLGASQLGSAQTPELPVSDVAKSLEASVEGRHLTLLSPIQVDAIAEGETSTFNFTVPTDAVISVRGACDGDCTDINLEVASVSGAILGADTEDDAVPQVNLVGSQHSTKLVVTLSMDTCLDDPCSVAVGVYQR